MRMSGWEGVDYGFNFMAHSEILKGEGKNLVTVDVAGIVVSCGDMEVFPNERKRMNFDLQDVQGEVVRCTLWNGYAQQFNDFLTQNNPIENVMAVIQHAKIKLWQGQYTVQNDKFGTRLFLNEQIHEVNELRRRLLVKHFEVGASSSQTILSSQSVFPVRQEFLIDTPKKHVDEIIEIESVMSCVVVATIKIVQENYGWFYPACRNCNKKVLTKTEYLQYAKIISDEVMNLSPTSLVCPKCDKECTSITIKFKVHLRVKDETGSISFVMFDKDVTKLIGSTASDIRERQVKSNDTESFPHEISRLVEKKLAFKIEVSDYNLNHDYHVYTIQKLCDDPDILAELVVGNGNGLEVVDEVFSQEGSEIKVERLSESSQMAGAAISKDVVSVTADSSVVEAEKDSGTSPNGKRSLQDVEGQNIGELSSSSKNNRKRSSRVKT
ncbi:putative nucleic acid-binding, replication factor A [Helianthus annuus]|nr:putative nucleic acid-binding, replication factor A [Helianthus annuus]